MNNHSSCVLWKDCNRVNNTVCLATILHVIRAVVRGWKNLVSQETDTNTPRSNFCPPAMVNNTLNDASLNPQV